MKDIEEIEKIIEKTLEDVLPERSPKFLREVGAVLGPNQSILHLTDGTAGSTEFPEELIWAIHKNQPGAVWALSHVHPPLMPTLSGRDKMTLKTWAWAMYPFPIRIITITEGQFTTPSFSHFIETCYLGILESKEAWVNRGKNSARNFEILTEWETNHYLESEDSRKWYGNLLLERSYEKKGPDN